MDKYELHDKMQKIMYQLTKNSARESYMEFLADLGITWDEYEMIKQEWKDKLDITPYV